MPLHRPALTLGTGARGVQSARRWVSTAFEDMDRAELVEAAEIGVSELVTNALLHGSAPLEVRVRGTVEHPRVEVRDCSTEPPVLPAPVHEHDPDEAGADADDLLLTYGRGLSIVARASQAWGAEIEDDGKVVWFVPASQLAEDDGPAGQITGTVVVADQTGDDPDDVVEIHLDEVPVRSFLSFERHLRELRREVRLLALAHEDDYPLAKNLADLFGTLGRPIQRSLGADQVARAQERGQRAVDLALVLGRSQALELAGLDELLDLTDAFARGEKLLALARSPEQREFSAWFLGELRRQAAGEAPRSWDEGHPMPYSSVS